MSARAEAAEAWALFLDGAADPLKNKLEIPLSRAGFLSFFGSLKVRIVGVTVSATFSDKYNVPLPDGTNPAPSPFQITLAPPGQSVTGDLLFRTGEPSVTFMGPTFTPVVLSNTPAPWVLSIAKNVVPDVIRAANGLVEPDAFEDLWLTFAYEVIP